MSILSSEIHTALAELLQKLPSPDNQARTLAEERLNNEWFITRPDVLLMGLVEQIQLSQEPSVRHLPRVVQVMPNQLIHTTLSHADAVFCSSLISQNVNEDKEGGGRGPGVKRAISVAAKRASNGDKTKAAGMSSERGAPTSKAQSR